MNPLLKLNRLVAFVWLVIIGTGVADYYSETAPYHGAVILTGAAYFLFLFHIQFLRLLFFKDYLLIFLLLVVPILLMLLSDRSFERSDYTSQISVALVFVVASILGLRTELNGPFMIAAFVIVAVGTALNLYELLVENNVWSTAPGRSAGWYINPNISAEALLGYGLAFLTASFAKLRKVDLILITLVIVGVFVTFSRAGILACLVLVTVVVSMRVGRKYLERKIVVGAIVLLSIFALGWYIFQELDLSEDATIRILSLRDSGGIGDYGVDRGAAAFASLELFAENPLFGTGVRAIYAMEEGPHNMFLAMLVDYGIGGLIAYLVVIVRLMLIARRADRDLSGPIWFYVAWLVIFSFSSHNLLGDTETIPLLGFAIARAYKIHSLI